MGDSADGYPGIRGIGPKGAAALIARYGALEEFPVDALGERRELALLFKRLATLRTDAALFAQAEDLRWQGPTTHAAEWVERLGTPRLLARAQASAGKRKQP